MASNAWQEGFDAHHDWSHQPADKQGPMPHCPYNAMAQDGKDWWAGWTHSELEDRCRYEEHDAQTPLMDEDGA